MPGYRILLASGLASTLLHLAFFILPLHPGVITSKEGKSISAVLISPPSAQANMATSHRSETNETVWRDLPPSSTELSSKLPTDKLPIAETYFPPGETAFGSEDLDSPVKVITEPDLEPPKGYPKDVHGVATLTLLIDTDGHVRWVNLDSTDFKAEINERITEAFSKTLFYPPYKNGKPVRAVFKIQISIGEI